METCSERERERETALRVVKLNCNNYFFLCFEFLTTMKVLWMYSRIAWNDNYSTPTITVFIERDLVYSELRS
jgi:hypothetical protein